MDQDADGYEDQLAEALKTMVWEQTLVTGMIADLVRDALAEVDWYEVASDFEKGEVG